MGRDLIDGFDNYYRPNRERIEGAFNSGIIVLDTNVLLNVLRYSVRARVELISVIESVSDRCFIPYQVAAEYNKNRVTVVKDRIEEIKSQLESARKATQVLENLRERRIVSSDKIDNLEAEFERFMDQLDEVVGQALNEYDLDPDAIAVRVDEWTESLSKVLSGRVAIKPTDDQLQVDVAEGRRRHEMRVAPGFKDREVGDYLWWAEVLRMEPKDDKPLVIVSDDAAKGDWRYEVRGMTAGPHANLTDDAIRSGFSDLVLLTTREFLRLAKSSSDIEVSQSTIDESETELEAIAIEWNFAEYLELLEYLRLQGKSDRVSVIREAGAAGGALNREGVYRIAGIEEGSRSLRQFATPVISAMNRLAFLKIIRRGLPEALWAYYDGPGKAIGYAVPEEFSKFEDDIRRMLSPGPNSGTDGELDGTAGKSYPLDQRMKMFTQAEKDRISMLLRSDDWGNGYHKYIDALE